MMKEDMDRELTLDELDMVSGGGKLEDLYNWLNANGHIKVMQSKIRKEAVCYGLSVIGSAPPPICYYAMYLNAIYDII